jgi:hypothetical protein
MVSMWDPPWKRLIESLTDTGFDSPYLDRLRTRVEVMPDRQSLERELLQEMARALGRTCDKVNLALLQLQLIQRQIDDTTESARHGELVRAYNQQREQARIALRELIIHREALGMVHNQHLKKEYPIPPRKNG